MSSDVIWAMLINMRRLKTFKMEIFLGKWPKLKNICHLRRAEQTITIYTRYTENLKELEN